MKTIMKNIFLILGFVTLLIFTGCPFGGEKLPEGLSNVVPVTIQLTQDGAPLAGATVLLIDTTGSREWSPGGLTDDKGTIDLYTNGRYKGAPEGKYKVVVTKTETDPSKLGPAPSTSDPGYSEYLGKLASEKRDTYTLIDKQFTDAKSTPLEVEIKKGGPVQKFDVGAKVKIKIS